MKILVTGGAGFIGSNFIRYILKKYNNYRVVNLDILSYCGNLDNLRDIERNPRYKFIKGDICDSLLVNKIFQIEKPDFVVNFAAATHVDRSILEPEIFTKTNILGTHILLETARKYRIKRFEQISCYDENTRALTVDGLKKFNDLKKGDIVLSINPKTGNVEEKEIEKIIVQDYEGEMIHFKNNRVDLLITPNHRIYYQKRFGKSDKIYFDEAKNIFNKTGLMLPKAINWKGIDKKFIAAKGIGMINTRDLFYLSGLFIGDGFTAYQEKEIETKSGLKRKDFLEKARDEFGRFSKIKKKSNYKTISKSYRIFFDIPEGDKARQKLENTLRKLKIRFSRQKGKSGEHIYFSSRPWLDYFNQFGDGVKNKHIPQWMLKYDKKYLQYLFEGLIDSDGFKRKLDFQYTTIADKLLSSIVELGYKLGYRIVFKKRRNKSYFNGRKIEGSVYYIYFSNQSSKSIGKENAKKEYYKGEIWCVKVKDNKNLIVERNGKFDFCGNTDEVYGTIKEGKFKETNSLLPNSPYAASKAGADLLVRAYYKTFGLPVLITRSSNNFGHYQYPEKLIPLFITNLLENKKIPLYGKGLNIRDWIYVLDNCSGIDTVLHKGKIGEIYNIGGSNEKTNLEITKIILKELNKDESCIKYVKDRPGHDFRYAVDTGKIQRLGWKSQYKFAEALKDTIKWYQNNRWWWEKIKSGEYLKYYKKQYKRC